MSALQPAVCSAVTISLSPANTTVNQGDVLTLSVDVADAADLFLFQFGVSFDPLIFSALEPLAGSFLDTSTGFFSSGCPFNLCPTPPGTLSLIGGFGPLTDPLATSGSLATLSFTAIASTGLSPSTIALTFNPLDGDGLFEFTGLFPLVFSSDASVTVIGPTAAVPEPTTMLLLGSGLAAAIRRRRRVSASSRTTGC